MNRKKKKLAAWILACILAMQISPAFAEEELKDSGQENATEIVASVREEASEIVFSDDAEQEGQTEESKEPIVIILDVEGQSDQEFDVKKAYEQLMELEDEEGIEEFWKSLTEEQAKLLEEYILEQEELQPEEEPVAEQMTGEQKDAEEGNAPADEKEPEEEAEKEAAGDGAQNDELTQEDENDVPDDEQKQEGEIDVKDDALKQEDEEAEKTVENEPAGKEEKAEQPEKEAEDAASDDREDVEEEQNEPEQASNDEIVASINFEYEKPLTIGDTVMVVANISNIRQEDIKGYIWYVDRGDGLEEIEGNNSPTYQFELTNESVTYAYKVKILVCRNTMSE